MLTSDSNLVFGDSEAQTTFTGNRFAGREGIDSAFVGNFNKGSGGIFGIPHSEHDLSGIIVHIFLLDEDAVISSPVDLAGYELIDLTSGRGSDDYFLRNFLFLYGIAGECCFRIGSGLYEEIAFRDNYVVYAGVCHRSNEREMKHVVVALRDELGENLTIFVKSDGLVSLGVDNHTGSESIHRKL